MTSITTDPIADLWREARTWLADAMHAFLGPAEVARTLARAVRAALKRRLLRIEALLMKLLLIEAARSGGPPASSRPARANSRTAATNQNETDGWRPAVDTEDPANPQTWRVRFRVRIPPDRPLHERPRDTGGPRIRDLGRPLLVRDIWRQQARRQRIDRLRRKPHAAAEHARAQAKAMRLARRFEALRRVIAEPRRAIAALARKLHALGKAAHAVARRIALAPAPRGKREGMVHANAVVRAYYVLDAWPAPDSS